MCTGAVPLELCSAAAPRWAWHLWGDYHYNPSGSYRYLHIIRCWTGKRSDCYHSIQSYSLPDNNTYFWCPGVASNYLGRCFGANETVTVKWNCTSSTCTSTMVLGTITTDANGNFNGLSTEIPKPVGVGSTYTIGATGGTSKAFAATHYKVTS